MEVEVHCTVDVRLHGFAAIRPARQRDRPVCYDPPEDARRRHRNALVRAHRERVTKDMARLGILVPGDGALICCAGDGCDNETLKCSTGDTSAHSPRRWLRVEGGWLCPECQRVAMA